MDKTRNYFIDISHWTGEIDWEKVASFDNGAIKLVIAKATDSYNGNMFADSKIIKNILGAKSVGLPIGVFHWLQCDVAPKTAANYITNLVEKYDPALYVVDVEERNIVSASDYAWRAQEWLNLVEGITNKRPKIYTAEWYMKTYLRDPLIKEKKDYKKILGWMGSYDLWVAGYPSSRFNFLGKENLPKIPQEWEDYTMWQFASNVYYPYPGVSEWENKVYGNGWDIFGTKGSKGFDMNVFHCSVNKLLGKISESENTEDNVQDNSKLELEQKILDMQTQLSSVEDKINRIKEIVA